MHGDYLLFRIIGINLVMSARRYLDPFLERESAEDSSMANEEQWFQVSYTCYHIG